MSELSLLIRGAEVIDGTGRPAVRADVGVRDGRVAFVEPGAAGASAEPARETIDADGLILSPGLHRSAYALRRPARLGRERLALESPRRDDRDRRQLRLHDRADRRQRTATTSGA